MAVDVQPPAVWGVELQRLDRRAGAQGCPIRRGQCRDHGAGQARPLSVGVGDSLQIIAAGQIVDVASAEQGVRHGPWSRDRLLYWANPSSEYRAMYQVPPANLASLAWNPVGTLILATDGPDAYSRLFAVNMRGHQP